MKYPYIGKGLNSGSVVLFYEQNTGVTLESKSWTSKDFECSDCINENIFEDITREYLSNTRGKVESKEHAEFIAKLAENAGYEIDKGCKIGSFFFVASTYYGFGSEKYFHHRAKLITIPLPPKDDKSDCHALKAVTERLVKMTELMSKACTENAGDEAVDTAIDALSYYINSSGEAQKEPESKVWPQVGDGVLYDGSSHRLKSIKGEVLKVIARYSFDGIDYITVLHDYDGVFAMPIGSWIKKPKTPEEELRDELIAVTDKYRNHELSTQEVIAKAIINCEIKGLTYKL